MSSWPWPDELEGTIAAPDSHEVRLETDEVRVLEVVIEPGACEPEHVHRHASVMIVDEPARIRYYQAGVLKFESPAEDDPTALRVRWMDPEGPHSVENIDSRRYHAYRIELLG